MGGYQGSDAGASQPFAIGRNAFGIGKGGRALYYKVR